MAKIDANLDACQISSELMVRLRKIVRESLRAVYGTSWEENGLASELREFLTQRQAREASITWNLSDTIDLLDFASYVDLYEIIAAVPGLLQRFLPFAPDPNVLRIRFLELDSIMNRIAFARPVSESDLGLLVSFEERLKRTAAVSPPAVEAAANPPAPRRKTTATPPATAPGAAAPPPPAPATPPPPTEKRPEPQPSPEPEPVPATEAEEPAAAPAASAPAVLGPPEIESALKRGDSAIVLTALYQEVTALADGLWNGSVAPLSTHTWETVRESQWYRAHFVKLNLRPISDFFGLVDAATERTRAGASRNELQDFLKEHNFVQVLMALKDLFRLHVRR